MQPDRCLHVCLIGDSGTGQSSFLQCYRTVAGGNTGGSQHKGKEFSSHHPPFPPASNLESLVAVVELDGEPCRVRFTDGAGGPYFQLPMQQTALSAAHVTLVCFRSDSPESLQHIKEKWLPILWSSGMEGPWLLLALATDMRERRRAAGDVSGTVSQEEGEAFAQRYGAWAYVESSAFFPETVQLVVDEALAAGITYYRKQWQFSPMPSGPLHSLSSGGSKESSKELSKESEESQEMAAKIKPSWRGVTHTEPEKWLMHEKLNVGDDPVGLTEEQVKAGLSQLGDTGTRQHAYLRCDLQGLSLTSLNAIRPWEQLQFLNVSRNQLRHLEPVGALRNLLHLNASHNLLVRSQCFTAPDALETIDMSYNMIAELGDWKVHRYLRELNLRGNYIKLMGTGLMGNKELRMLDLSENYITEIENLDNLNLRVLNVAQNRLGNLEGVQTLEKLQSLDARHNNITTISALRAQDIPRLRKLRVSENRISQIRELDNLAEFSFLSDFYLDPNPLSELPQLRAQVLHRLPRLRSMDLVQVTAEERVKTDLVYGADTETRREIFESLLPEETFVDRRLMTEEKIAAIELEEFGQNGDVGPYGRDGNQDSQTFGGGGPPRSRLQQGKFRSRIEQARYGGDEGVADFANFPAPFLSLTVTDEDLPEVMEAVAEGGVEELLLGAARISVTGLRELISFLRDSPCRLRHVDLAGSSAVASLGVELVNTFPFSKGCSVETENCGLHEQTVERLRNQTLEAQQALELVAAERHRSAEAVSVYMREQEALEDVAAEYCARDAAPPPPPRLCHPLKWRSGVEKPSQAALQEFLKTNANGLSQSGSSYVITNKAGRRVPLNADKYKALRATLENMLKEFGCEALHAESPEDGMNGGKQLPGTFLEAFGPTLKEVIESKKLLGFMLWEGVEPSTEVIESVRRDPEEWTAHWKAVQERFQRLSDQAKKAHDVGSSIPGVASGQLISHLSHLSLPMNSDTIKPPSFFNFTKVSDSKRPHLRFGQDLHAALAARSVAIVSCTGTGFGIDSVRIELKNLVQDNMTINIRRGTIFQQQGWQHRQNLLVGIDYCIEVPAGSTIVKHMHGYCINRTCALSQSSPLDLTDFYLDDDTVLASQAVVWDHFEGIFKKGQ
mmetsp:Transcript_103145/g.183283  ORF Transcript_103145/g.183283 Transcript_103145/m.183283 type:complete len:1129 (-) Transcript_103145:35-3421(-)